MLYKIYLCVLILILFINVHDQIFVLDCYQIQKDIFLTFFIPVVVGADCKLRNVLWGFAEREFF